MNGIRVNFSTVCDILGLGQQIRQQRGGVPIGQEVSNFVNGPENIRKSNFYIISLHLLRKFCKWTIKKYILNFRKNLAANAYTFVHSNKCCWMCNFLSV